MKNKNIIISGSEGLLGTSYRNFIEKECKNLFCLDIKNIKRKNYYKCDITNENQVKNVVESISKKHTIDILINNASYNPIAKNNMRPFKFVNYSLNEWKKNISVDLIGSFLLSKYVLRIFEKKNKGKIINISSIYALLGPDQEIYSLSKFKKYSGYKKVEYSVAKAGILGFTKSLASYYKGSEIQIVCLIFGGVENNQPNFFIKKYEKKTINNRMARIGEYNEYLKFYSSDKASYSSGSCIIVDGGALSFF